MAARPTTGATKPLTTGVSELPKAAWKTLRPAPMPVNEVMYKRFPMIAKPMMSVCGLNSMPDVG